MHSVKYKKQGAPEGHPISSYTFYTHSVAYKK
jgi:hypothetical protein